MYNNRPRRHCPPPYFAAPVFSHTVSESLCFCLVVVEFFSPLPILSKEMKLKGSNWMPEEISVRSRGPVHYLLASWSNTLLSGLPSSSLPMLWMPDDGEGAGGQDIHHIWTHLSSCSSQDTKLCSLRRALAGIEMRRNESSRLYSHTAPIYR